MKFNVRIKYKKSHLHLQIESDFSTLYPGTQLSILKNWDLFFEKVLALKGKEIEETRDPILQDTVLKLKETLAPGIFLIIIFYPAI